MIALRIAMCMTAALVFGLAGCDSPSDSAGRTGAASQPPPLAALKPMDRPPVPDVPIPRSFKLDVGRSRNYDTGVARFVDHLYKGRKDKWDVFRFYRDQMPVSRWTYVNNAFVQGRHTLEFDKGSERCVVTIRKGSWLHPTYIEVRVTTVGRIAVHRSSSSSRKGTRGK